MTSNPDFKTLNMSETVQDRHSNNDYKPLKCAKLHHFMIKNLK